MPRVRRPPRWTRWTMLLIPPWFSRCNASMSGMSTPNRFSAKRDTSPRGGVTVSTLRAAQSARAAEGRCVEAQPFLKWAGGKTQLLTQFECFFPTSVASYIEPFLGGGAVFFHLKARFPEMRAVLRDNNAELINCYKEVRDHCHELMRRLEEHLNAFRADGARYYYFVRSLHDLVKPGEKAARMIFLNKTCYNGLWRVNARGQFNVPIGSYRPDKVSLYNEGNLLAARRELQRANLGAEDFRETLRTAGPADFVYIDPPYYPLSATANFTSYTKEDFGQAEQEELSALVAEASRRGARVMLSNSDTPFIRKLYKDFAIYTVSARRAVNCDGAKRGRIPEVVVVNYETQKGM